jgi:hypothetical protein
VAVVTPAAATPQPTPKSIIHVVIEPVTRFIAVPTTAAGSPGSGTTTQDAGTPTPTATPVPGSTQYVPASPQVGTNGGVPWYSNMACRDPKVPQEQYTGRIRDVYVSSESSTKAFYGIFRSNKYQTDGISGIYLYTMNPYILSQMQIALATGRDVHFEGYRNDPNNQLSFSPCYIEIMNLEQ